MVITKSVPKHSKADHIMMCDFVACADKYFGRAWRLPIRSGDKPVMKLTVYTCCTLYGELTAIYHGLNILTSNCMLLHILASSGLTDDVDMCILGHIFGRFIGSVTVD